MANLNFLPTVIWRMPPEHVYLTFDDGPDPEITPAILSLFREHKVRATFFVLGEKAQRHPQIIKQIFENGHAIGNHSFRHPRLVRKNKDFIRAEVTKTDAAVAEIIGKKPALFRPPYGRFGADLLSILNETRHQMILWSASTKDYKSAATAETISRNFLKHAKPGKIILLHDGHVNSRATLSALKNTLGDLSARGITFSPIPET
jgi:peptidoglycan/xylan/chitin deacetylase (PgdA/CDA1 family)